MFILWVARQQKALMAKAGVEVKATRNRGKLKSLFFDRNVSMSFTTCNIIKADETAQCRAEYLRSSEGEF
jgi:hypothetical protein